MKIYAASWCSISLNKTQKAHNNHGFDCNWKFRANQTQILWMYYFKSWEVCLTSDPYLLYVLQLVLTSKRKHERQELIREQNKSYCCKLCFQWGNSREYFLQLVCSNPEFLLLGKSCRQQSSKMQNFRGTKPFGTIYSQS